MGPYRQSLYGLSAGLCAALAVFLVIDSGQSQEAITSAHEQTTGPDKERALTSGCDYVIWGSDKGKPIPYTLEQMRMSGQFPDVMPWNYKINGIEQAWARTAGDNIKVAVIDTGVFKTQTQLQNPIFSSPAELGVQRSVALLQTLDADPWAVSCSHGTRMAATITGPHDGKNIIGVAWKADLVSIKALPNVVIPDWHEQNIVKAIHLAVANGAKIIAFAIGRHSDSEIIAKAIRETYNSKDVLFFAAAGTDVCLGDDWVAFPARMNEVIAVAGVKENGDVHPSSCAGKAVDLAAVIGETPAAGRTPNDFIHFGGSSGATAIVAGVAALVWSAHPNWTRDLVRQRLYSTATPNRRDRTGNGRIDTYRAVGGFTALGLSYNPAPVGPNQRYRVTATPYGDGPFSFAWGGGQTTPYVDEVAGTAGTTQNFRVTVTDTLEKKAITRSLTVTSGESPPPCPGGQKCCKMDNNRCVRCIPNAQECAACPAGQRCCETRPSDGSCAICRPTGSHCP